MRGRVSLSRAATLECVWPKQRISNSWNGDRPVSFRKFRRFSIVPNLAAEFIVAICLAHSNIFHHAYLLYKVFNAKIHENIIQTFKYVKLCMFSAMKISEMFCASTPFHHRYHIYIKAYARCAYHAIVWIHVFHRISFIPYCISNICGFQRVKIPLD